MMDSETKELLELLKKSPLFEKSTSIDIARIIPYIARINLNPEETLFTAGSPATNLYLIDRGTIELRSSKRHIDSVSEGTLGEESVFEDVYISDAVAVTAAVVFAIPREHIQTIFSSSPHLKEELYRLLTNHLCVQKLGKCETAPTVKKYKKDRDAFKIVGWGLTIVAPIVILYFGNLYGIEWKSKIFLMVAASTTIMWIFRLAHEFVPSIFAVLVILILDLAPPEVALSGFTSGSFFMALSIFGLSGVLVSSGLAYRLVVVLLRVVPRSQFWYNTILLIIGIFLTPIIPSANGRISLANPILSDMVDSLGYKRRGKAATKLAVSTFSGFTLFSGIFLSSKSIHFVVFGLLPMQVQEQFNWGYWFYASLAVGAVLLVLYLLSSNLIFKNNEESHLEKETIAIQQKVLGPLNGHEWAALGGILLFLLGIVTSSIHKIDISWIGLMVLYVVLALEFLSKKEFINSIDWSFLIFLGTLIGLVKTMSYIGLDQNIGKYLVWFGEYARSNFALFIFLLSASIFIVRLFIPNNATVAIFVAVFLPIAEITGINPWIIGFIILFMSDAWLMPYQCTYYLQLEELTRAENIYHQKLFLRYNALTILFRLAAIYASIPFWKMLGIL